MNSLTKFISLLPLLIIIGEIFFLRQYNLSPTLNPISPKNNFTKQVYSLLNTAQLSPINFTDLGYQDEIQFYLKNPSGTAYSVVFSTQRSPISQVTALQKVIKIANIKRKDIHFIDLSLESPYATL